jgi:hypothetical protein
MFPRNRMARCGIAYLLLTIIAAFFWLMIPASTQAAIPQSERDALIAFYNGTNGAQWDGGHTWLGPVGSECGWSGVTCDAAQNNVLELRLYQRGLLRGTIPAALADLTKLQRLHLYSNSLSGNIPAAPGNLTELTSLALSNNQLSGSIPSELGNIKNLLQLILESNRLTGSIPASLGNLTRLTSQTFNLSNNGLFASNDTLKAFLDAHATWGSQTVAPGSVSAQPESSSSLLVQRRPYPSPPITADMKCG